MISSLSGVKKLRVLLVGPWKGKDAAGDSFLAPPFGLYRMKFHVEERFPEVSVDVLDPNIHDYTAVGGPYELVGVSPLHLTLENDLNRLLWFRKRYPEAIFAAGGIEISFLGKDFFDQAPVDLIILGEGEKALRKIVEILLRGGRDFGNVSSVYWRSDSGVRFGGYAEQLNLEDLCEIQAAFNYRDVPYADYWKRNASLYAQPRWIEIKTIRGIFSNFCPLGCAFCASTHFISFSYSGSVQGKARLHMLPVDNVLDSIARAVQAYPDVMTIMFDDDNLSLDFRYLEKLCAGISNLKKSGDLNPGLTFICQGRPDAFAAGDPGVFVSMRAAGFRMIMYGVESFSERILATLGKSMTKERIAVALQATRDAGITPLIYIILFPPAVRKGDLIETVDCCVEEFSRDAEISVTLSIMDIPGCDFHVSDSSRRIAGSPYLWPLDEEMFLLSRDINDNYHQYEEEFKRAYEIKHVPGRIYSLVLFDAVYQKAGLHDRRFKLKHILESRMGGYQ